MFSINIERLHFPQGTDVATNEEGSAQPLCLRGGSGQNTSGLFPCSAGGLRRLRIRGLIVNTRNL